MGKVALIPLNPPAPDSFARRTSWNASAVLKMWHLASLDAPTVAVTWACALGWAAAVRLPGWPLAVLGLLVWAIYVADRLLDAHAGLGQPSRQLQERHYFHWRHRRWLIILSACAAVAAAWMIASQFVATALRRDSLMGLATVAYLSTIHAGRGRAGLFHRVTKAGSRILSRECVVGMLFSAGCLLPALARSSDYVVLAAPAVALAALAWLNVFAIGTWESDGVRRKPTVVRVPALLLGFACVAFGMGVAGTEPRSAVLVAAAGASALLLAALDAKAARLEAVVLRALADLVLLTPAFILAAGLRA